MCRRHNMLNYNMIKLSYHQCYFNRVISYRRRNVVTRNLRLQVIVMTFMPLVLLSKLCKETPRIKNTPCFTVGIVHGGNSASLLLFTLTEVKRGRAIMGRFIFITCIFPVLIIPRRTTESIVWLALQERPKQWAQFDQPAGDKVDTC